MLCDGLHGLSFLVFEYPIAVAYVIALGHTCGKLPSVEASAPPYCMHGGELLGSVAVVALWQPRRYSSLYHGRK
jgi:hypothetical protein